MIKGDRIMLTTRCPLTQLHSAAERAVFEKRPKRVQLFEVNFVPSLSRIGRNRFSHSTGSRWLKEKSRLRRGLVFWGDVAGRCQKQMGSASWSAAAQRTRPILLNARDSQTGKAVRLERTLPGEELLLR